MPHRAMMRSSFTSEVWAALARVASLSRGVLLERIPEDGAHPRSATEVHR
jgi:hypothetical protein